MLMDEKRYTTFKKDMESLAQDEALFAKHFRSAMSCAVKESIVNNDQRYGRLFVYIITDNVVETNKNGDKINRHQFANIKRLCRGCASGAKRFFTARVFTGRSGCVSKAKVQDILAELKGEDIYHFPQYAEKFDSVPSAVASLVKAVNDCAGDTQKTIQWIIESVNDLVYETLNKVHAKGDEEKPYNYDKDTREGLESALAYLKPIVHSLRDTSPK